MKWQKIKEFFKKDLLKRHLFTKNRLVIVNDDTFEEVFSLKLTLMNVFVFATLGAILIIFVTTFIIAFTPLREYIPGYTSTKLKREATELALKSDSLKFAIKKNELYLESIKKVLNGKLEYAKVNKDSIMAIRVDTLPELQLDATKAELELRKEVELIEKTKKK
ncbi:peptidase [Flavobacterium croceum]|uniref:peptidase n=1 Tax=Flavobacterium croceum TaxID=370975 RepID=UPI0024A9DCA8|nr:peptidase [Flavobacterium croceum]